MNASFETLLVAFNLLRSIRFISTRSGYSRLRPFFSFQSPTEHKVHFDPVKAPRRLSAVAFNLLRSIRFISTVGCAQARGDDQAFNLLRSIRFISTWSRRRDNL